MTDQRSPSLARVLRFWLPLAGTWLMMSVEGPLLAAVIARLAEPKINLAAYGVAFSLALIVEAPVIMMLSAATALVRDRDSYHRLRRFTNGLNLLITLVLAAIAAPPVFRVLAITVLGLDAEVARLTSTALWLLLPWPATIGYRRFYQGILIRHGEPEKVAQGTVVRLVAMVGSVAVLAFATDLNGAAVGPAALSVGVTAEAIVARLMARRAVRRVLETDAAMDATPLELPVIIRFYTPLALTSLLGLAVHPMVTFFMGHGRLPLESLAVLPVVNSLVFIFRSLGLAAQEVFIALYGEQGESEAVLRRFAWMLGAVAAGGLAIIAYTPLADLWFITVSGLTPELAAIAGLPVRILALIPGLTVLLSWQRAMLVNAGRTGAVSWATSIEVAVAGVVLAVGIFVCGFVGATVAAAALLAGRLAANAFLLRPAGVPIQRV